MKQLALSQLGLTAAVSRRALAHRPSGESGALWRRTEQHRLAHRALVAGHGNACCAHRATGTANGTLGTAATRMAGNADIAIATRFVGFKPYDLRPKETVP